MQLPLGQHFSFQSQLTAMEAKRAVRSIINKRPDKIDNIWGIATSRIIFLQEGYSSSPPGLIAILSPRNGRVQISGYAGVNLGGLAILGTGLAIGTVISASALLINGRWGFLAAMACFGAFLYGVAWLNHVFRTSADPLIHSLKRALKDNKLEQEDRRYSDTPVKNATLIIDGDERTPSPSPRSLREALLSLADDHFLIVEFAGETYMQVLNQGGEYRLEVREGSADRHYFATPDLLAEQTVDVLVRYLTNGERPGSLDWRKIDFD